MAFGITGYAGLLAVPIILVVVLRWRISRAQQQTFWIRLGHSPNHLNIKAFILLWTQALTKHLLAVLRCTIPTTPDPRSPQSFILPQIKSEGLLRFSKEDEKLFARSVDQAPESTTKSPLFLVTLTLPLVTHILASLVCPIRPLGAVNTRNLFKIHEPQLVRDLNALRTASKSSCLSYEASFGGPESSGHRRKRGMEFCIHVRIMHNGTLVMSQELWFLQFLPSSTEPLYKPETQDEKEGQTNATLQDLCHQTLSIRSSDPPKWASASKDYNPIHLSQIGAKLFGFKSVIAHGNHVVAMALEQLRKAAESDMQARDMIWQDARPFQLDVQFLRPITLPAESQLLWKAPEPSDEDMAMFEVKSGDKVCITGVVERPTASVT